MTDAVKTLLANIDRLPDIKLADDVETRLEAAERRLRAETEYRLRAESEAQALRDALKASQEEVTKERAAREAVEGTFAQLRQAEATARDALMAEQVTKIASEQRLHAANERLMRAEAEFITLRDTLKTAQEEASKERTARDADDRHLVALADLNKKMEESTQRLEVLLRASIMQAPTVSQSAKYEFELRRDGAGVLRTIVATPT